MVSNNNQLPLLGLSVTFLSCMANAVVQLNVSPTVHHELTIQNHQRDALNIIYSSNIITLLYMFRVSSTPGLPKTGLFAAHSLYV